MLLALRRAVGMFDWEVFGDGRADLACRVVEKGGCLGLEGVV